MIFIKPVVAKSRKYLLLGFCQMPLRPRLFIVDDKAMPDDARLILRLLSSHYHFRHLYNGRLNIATMTPLIADATLQRGIHRERFQSSIELPYACAGALRRAMMRRAESQIIFDSAFVTRAITAVQPQAAPQSVLQVFAPMLVREELLHSAYSAAP